MIRSDLSAWDAFDSISSLSCRLAAELRGTTLPSPSITCQNCTELKKALEARCMSSFAFHLDCANKYLMFITACVYVMQQPQCFSKHFWLLILQVSDAEQNTLKQNNMTSPGITEGSGLRLTERLHDNAANPRQVTMVLLSFRNRSGKSRVLTLLQRPSTNSAAPLTSRMLPV